MEIIWNQNPLRTSVILDDSEKAILRLKVHIDVLEDVLSNIAYDIAHDKNFTLDTVEKIVDYKVWCGDFEDEPSKLHERTIKLTKIYCDELESGFHVGDCTCDPCSCFKCIAESYVGVDTTKGLGKHEGHYIANAFADNITIDEAISSLENYNPKATWPGWEAHASRWKADAKQALDWLVAYRNEHFPQEGR